MRNVGNDDLNYFSHSLHDAHYRCSSFEKVKMCQANFKFEKFENIVNLIYTVCAMSGMMINTMFAIVNMMRITGVVISKVKMCRKNCNFEKI